LDRLISGKDFFSSDGECSVALARGTGLNLDAPPANPALRTDRVVLSSN